MVRDINCWPDGPLNNNLFLFVAKGPSTSVVSRANTWCGCFLTFDPGIACLVKVLCVRWHQMIFCFVYVKPIHYEVPGDTAFMSSTVAVIPQQSPVSVLTTVDVTQLCCSRPLMYSKHHATYTVEQQKNESNVLTGILFQVLASFSCSAPRISLCTPDANFLLIRNKRLACYQK
jgi:hypothetical protein